MDHKRGSEHISLEDAELARIRAEVSAETHDGKPLKKARSRAELTRVKQGHLLIMLNCLNVIIAGLIALKTFGFI